jgi:RHS repeat-associated protein
VARYQQTQNIDEPLTMLRSSATSYFHADGLGSITSLSNSAGTIANTYTYDSYGNLTASTGTLVNPFQYTARESDPETGLYYYRARYYDPSTGRFNSEDPLGSSVGVNNYSAMGNNPVKYSDAFGLDYNVNYDPKTNTLIVTATIGIYGPNASSQLANSWQKSANDAWNKGNWKHGSCSVRFDFTFNYLPNFHQATSPGPQNLIFIEPDTLPFDIQGITYTNFGYWSQNMLPWDVAHEVGHLLFLPDDYGILSRGNHSGHMMSNSIVRSVVQHEVDSVVGKAPCGCN